jgi:type I restriction enzyme S subunit
MSKIIRNIINRKKNLQLNEHEDWQHLCLSEIGYTYPGLFGKNKDDFGTGRPYIPYLNIFNNTIVKDGEFDFVNIEVNENQSTVEKGDLFFTTSSETPKEVGMCSVYIGETKELYLNSFCFGFRISVSNKAYPIYIAHYFRSNIGRKLIYRLAQGATRYNLSKSSLLNENFCLPTYNEQIKITEILNNWDLSIDKVKALIELKEKRKKALMQQLLTGKKRLKGFNGKAKYHTLKNYIYEITLRKKNNDINNVLSVTNTKGFINQDEQFDKSVASDDLSNYKIIKKGQFAYNPSRVNVGSIDLLKSFNYGILSPMYIIFETDNKKLQSEFLYYHLKSHWFIGHIPMFVQGSVRNSLSFDGLCGMKFFIPSVEEQKEITSILLCADKEIELLKHKLELLKKQKRGLMQVLLTGKMRVNLNNKKMNIKITLTDFVDFVLLSGGKKLSKVREVKKRGGYDSKTDYYKIIREKIIGTLKYNKPISEINKAINLTTDDSKKKNYKLIIDGYKKFLGKKNLVYFEPPKNKYNYKELTLTLNPELGLIIKDVPHVIKLYFKKDKIEKDKIHSIICLMETQLKDMVDSNTKFTVLDIQKSKLYYKDKRKVDFMPLILGEADSFITMWNRIK